MTKHQWIDRRPRPTPFWLLAGLVATIGLGLASASLAAPPKALYGGIEIGSKGVKLAAFETSPSGAIVKPILRLRTINTDLIQDVQKTGAFNPKDVADTVKAVAELFQELRDLGVPAENIYVVGSSGLLAAKPESQTELVKAVEAETSRLKGPNKMEFITDVDEARLTALGVMDEAELGKGILLDIGGGNIKAGLLEYDDTAKKWKMAGSWSLQAGTKSFTSQVQEQVKKDGKPFPEAAAALRPALVGQIKDKIAADKRWADRKTVYLVGGIVWAVTSVFEPEMVESDKVALSADKFPAYAGKLRAMPLDLKPDLSKVVLNDARRTKAEAERDSALNVFPLNNLIAGNEVLMALSEAMDLGQAKSLYFDRQSLTAWLQGYVLEKIPRPVPGGQGAAPKEEGNVGKQLETFKAALEDARKDIGSLKTTVDTLALQLQKNQLELLGEIRKLSAPTSDGKKTDPGSAELVRSQKELTAKLADLADSLRGLAAQQAKLTEVQQDLTAIRTQTAAVQTVLTELRDDRKAMTLLQEEIGRTRKKVEDLEARLNKGEPSKATDTAPKAEARLAHSSQPASLNGRARFTIEVPSTGTVLFVDGVKAPDGTRGTVEFLTPALRPGVYVYHLRVEITTSGKKEQLVGQVRFSPDTENRVSLPESLTASRP